MPPCWANESVLAMLRGCGGEGERKEREDRRGCFRSCEELFRPCRIIEVYFNKGVTGGGWRQDTWVIFKLEDVRFCFIFLNWDSYLDIYFRLIQWFLHGLLLFSFCCSSSVAPSSVLVLFSGLNVSSTGSSPSEGLALLVGDVTRPFTSGCPCEPEVMDRNENTTEDRVSRCDMYENETSVWSCTILSIGAIFLRLRSCAIGCWRRLKVNCRRFVYWNCNADTNQRASGCAYEYKLCLFTVITHTLVIQVDQFKGLDGFPGIVDGSCTLEVKRVCLDKQGYRYVSQPTEII